MPEPLESGGCSPIGWKNGLTTDAGPKHRTGNNHERIYWTRYFIERYDNIHSSRWEADLARNLLIRPEALADIIRKRAPNAQRVVFETGPLSIWFYHTLSAEGLPAICIDARHAKAGLDMARNKTDANDADGLAHIAEAGFYREVRVKQYDSMLTRTLVASRSQLLVITTKLSNQIRGL